MNRAINTLKARIEKIHNRIEETQKVMDNPEMMCDYEFAMNDIGNYELEIMELQKAIEILLSYSDEKCFLKCTSCENDFDVETMEEDSGGNYFCKECYEELAPVMKEQYEEAVRNGEIDPIN